MILKCKGLIRWYVMRFCLWCMFILEKYIHYSVYCFYCLCVSTFHALHQMITTVWWLTIIVIVTLILNFCLILRFVWRRSFVWNIRWKSGHDSVRKVYEILTWLYLNWHRNKLNTFTILCSHPNIGIVCSDIFHMFMVFWV